ncbi:Gfo/Idh/MocA family oxidoreductase [Rhizobium sp. RCAM05973]|uniref:Gfo/Idh/MocA family protein n=1 Tax=Rhizobium sp. RCAM05973 TaxID=2994066 RepID=UPI0022EBAD09|nr:Gfo/Idh/MocA family oxidoreductase [Rhizobium sp. RCAM05973]
MNKLRIAIVGAGFMGLLHARVVADSDLAEVSAIIDPNVELGRQAAAEFGVSHFADAASALSAGAADAYIVAAPDRLHEAVTCELLEAGKPVLLEKPMAHTLDAAKAIAKAAKRAAHACSSAIFFASIPAIARQLPLCARAASASRSMPAAAASPNVMSANG